MKCKSCAGNGRKRDENLVIHECKRCNGSGQVDNEADALKRVGKQYLTETQRLAIYQDIKSGMKYKDVQEKWHIGTGTVTHIKYKYAELERLR